VTPQTLTSPLVRDVPLLDAAVPVADAVAQVLESGMPALPVVSEGRLCGIFGEREFVAALFPAYVKELTYAGFVPQELDAALDKRQSCRFEAVREHMNTEHVEVGTDFSDAQIAEIFLHHRVLIVPVVDDTRTVAGVIVRADFFRAIAERFLGDG
jgi:CBS domain-containing protein